MPVSLNDILKNPELEQDVSIEWVKAELAKQPYNQYLQGLLNRKSNSSGLAPLYSIKSFVDSIIADQKMNTGSSYYIRDIELDTDSTFAEAKEKEIEETGSTFAEAREEEIKEHKKNKITSAAIGAGAILTGSIVSGAKEFADEPETTDENPISQTDQIEESGLLGFLNRIDGTIKRSKPNAAMDPMLKEFSEDREPRAEHGDDSEKLEMGGEMGDEMRNDVIKKEPRAERRDEKRGKLEEPKSKVTVQMGEEAKKMKKVKAKANKGLRWSSMTAADYKMKTLDPFTVWINSIDGVVLKEGEVGQKTKKAKKKKKKEKHLDSFQDKPEIASEQLADLLVNQGHMQQAIAMYERLSLKYPEKSTFFAGKIDIIKDKL